MVERRSIFFFLTFFGIIISTVQEVESKPIFQYGRDFFVQIPNLVRPNLDEEWIPRRCKCPEGYRCERPVDGRERWPHFCIRDNKVTRSSDEIFL
ncbi:hypothetical protein M3Y98_00453200 [Aphelenchoides besseyi]|nr:hypothetical protein M3Y98_00453200 [Aphelenchoides besseyi]KAI6207415.1 hypothetical protein M3Y96_00006600 [Aphelenchoides besseyi]